MPTHEEVLATLAEYGGHTDSAARALNLHPRTVRRHRARQPKHISYTPHLSPKVRIPTLPDPIEPTSRLIERKIERWGTTSTAHAARKLIPITIDDPLPVGIAFFGDPHLDDDGCNFPLFMRDTTIVVNTPGLYAFSVGDMQNAWTKTLAHLYAEQMSTGAEAWRLAEWWVDQLGEKLIGVSGGNHDAWARNINGMGLLEWIREKAGILTEDGGVRFSVEQPGASRPVVINCRHDFPGSSIYNPAHGAAKAALIGWKDDLLVCGHTHASGYCPVKDPASGLVSHALRVASYKHIDHYAWERGLPDQNIFECPIVIIDPTPEDERFRCEVIFDPIRGAKYLTLLREERRGEQPLHQHQVAGRSGKRRR